MPNTPTEQSIWNAVVSKLETAQSSGLLTYVKNIYEGRKEDISADAFPAIMIEPDRTDEVDHALAGSSSQVRLLFRLDIFVLIRHNDREKQVVGEGTTRGILDIVNDVKNVLQVDPTLGVVGVNDSRFPTTEHQISLEEFPVRLAMIEMEVDFISRLTTR